MCFGPASPDAGVELLRQLFLQCIEEFSRMFQTPSPICTGETGINTGRRFASQQHVHHLSQCDTLLAIKRMMKSVPEPVFVNV